MYFYLQITFVPAALFRGKLKDMAAKLGYANAEIFPKQNKVDMSKGGTGSFLNLPYHNALLSRRYAIKDDGSAMDLIQFFEAHSKVKLTEDQLSKLTIQEEKQLTIYSKVRHHVWLQSLNKEYPTIKETMQCITLVFIVKKDFLTNGK